MKRNEIITKRQWKTSLMEVKENKITENKNYFTKNQNFYNI